MTSYRGAYAAVSILFALSLAGCNLRTIVAPNASSAVGITGKVHGGQQPVSGATIQLYTVGTTGDGSAATPLLSGSVMSDAGGNFSLANLFSCAGATQVYLVATGGNPGLSSSNPNLALMTAVGPCSSITPASFIFINELTTVAAVNALASYMTSPTSVGSGAADSGALASAFTLAAQYVNPSTGLSPGTGVPTGYSVPTAELNTLADILTSCINSTGGTAGDGSLCGALFGIALPANNVPPVDTVSAMLNLAQNPVSDISPLFNLIAANAPFQPTLSVIPADLSVNLTPPSSQTPLQFSPTPVSFSSTAVLTASAAQTLNIQNTGSGTVSFSVIASIGQNATDFSITDQCPSTLAGGSSCKVFVTFTPLAGASRLAYVHVVSSSPASSQLVTQDVLLTGTGIANSSSPAFIYVTNLNSNLDGQIVSYAATSTGTASPASTFTFGAGASDVSTGYLSGDHNGNLYAGSFGAYSGTNPVAHEFHTSTTGIITQSRQITGYTGPFAADNSGNLFVNVGANTDVFSSIASGSASPSFVLKNYGSTIMATDKSGNLYLLSSSGVVSVFNAGFTASSVPSATFTLSIPASFGALQSMAVDNSGNLYVLCYNGLNGKMAGIAEYSAPAVGTVSPSRTISGTNTQFFFPDSIAVDANGTIYVDDSTASPLCSPYDCGIILEFGPSASGNTAPTNTFLAPAVTYTYPGGGIVVH